LKDIKGNPLKNVEIKILAGEIEIGKGLTDKVGKLKLTMKQEKAGIITLKA